MSLPISPKVKRINSLTAAQRDRFPEWVAKWIAIGLSTAPADRPRAEAAIRAYYRAAKLPEPKRIAWTSSPLAGAFAFPAAALILEAERRHNGESVDASVDASVRASVAASVGALVRASVRDSVAASMHASVSDLVDASVTDSVRASVDASVAESVHDLVAASVGASVDASVTDSVRASVRTSVGDSVAASMYASVSDLVDASVRASVAASVGALVRASVRDSVAASMHASVSDLVRDSVRASVDDSVGDLVRALVTDSVGASVGDSVHASVRASVGASVGDLVHASVSDLVDDSVHDSVGASVRDSVRDSVAASMHASVADSVAESVSDSVGRLVGASVGASDPKVLAAYRAVLSQTYYRYMGGQFWVGYGWYGYWTSPSMLSYFRDVCGLDFGDKTEIVDAIIALGESCCWWWPHKEFAMASDRPAAIHRDERGRLHNESGHAIAFRDGTGVYSWHGVRVPAEIIIHPENITPKHIDDERNAEVRRVMLERFTLARYVTEGGAEVLHEDEHTARVPEWDETGKNPKLVAVREFKTPRRLLRKQLPEGDLLMIQLTNSSPEPDGTHKQYLLCCHPQLRPMPRRKGGPFGEPQKLTCHNAVASLVGMRGEDYSPDLES